MTIMYYFNHTYIIVWWHNDYNVLFHSHIHYCLVTQWPSCIISFTHTLLFGDTMTIMYYFNHTYIIVWWHNDHHVLFHSHIHYCLVTQWPSCIISFTHTLLFGDTMTIMYYFNHTYIIVWWHNDHNVLFHSHIHYCLVTQWPSCIISITHTLLFGDTMTIMYYFIHTYIIVWWHNDHNVLFQSHIHYCLVTQWPSCIISITHTLLCGDTMTIMYFFNHTYIIVWWHNELMYYFILTYIIVWWHNDHNVLFQSHIHYCLVTQWP